MAPGTHHALILLIDQQMTLSNLMYGGVLERFPELKVIVLECGGGWIAHWMDRLDEFLESYGWATPTLSLTPREYFQRQCWISFDPGERTAPLLWPLDRRRSVHVGVRLPALRREVSRRRRRAARVHRRRWTSVARAGLFGLQRGRHVLAVSTRICDLVVTGGTVVDGTGAPARTADVAIANGRIVEVGRLDASAARERIDADGLLVTPGFVDIHTHYDAQLHWDPTASPASWHGVTTLMTGNCGFTLAPSKPDDVDWLLLMLVAGRGHERRRARGGRPLPRRDARRLPRRARRPARRQRRRQRRALRGAPLRDGRRRVGARRDRRRDRGRCAGWCAPRSTKARSGSRRASWSCTSRTTAAACRATTPSPTSSSRWRRCCGEVGRGSIEFIPRTFLNGYDDDDRELVLAMARASGRPVHLNTLTLLPHAPDGWSRSLEFAQRGGRRRARRPSDVRDEPAGRALLARLDVPVRRDADLPRHADAARARALAAAARSRGPRPDAQGDRRPDGSFVRVRVAGRRGRDGPPPRARASRRIAPSRRSRQEQGEDPLDAFLDLSLAEDLQTQFVLAAPPSPKRQAVTETLIKSPLVMAGSSDGGAHLLSFCGADFTTRLLTRVDARRALDRGRGRAPHVDPRAGVRDHRPRNARSRQGRRRAAHRPRAALGRRDAALRARLPGRRAAATSSTRPDTTRSSSTARRCCATASTPAAARASSCDPSPGATRLRCG